MRFIIFALKFDEWFWVFKNKMKEDEELVFLNFIFIKIQLPILYASRKEVLDLKLEITGNDERFENNLVHYIVL